MKGCFHSTDEGKMLVQKMNTEFGLSTESASYIADMSGTSVDCRPFTDIPSKLFNDLTVMYNDSTLAAKVKSICYSDAFLEKFGNWIEGKTYKTATNSDGEPEVVWTHKDKTNRFIKFENSVGLAIANAIEDKIKRNPRAFEEKQYAVDRLRKYTLIKEAYDAGQALDQNLIKELTGKKSATKEEIKTALVKELMSCYESLRLVASDVSLIPAFVKYDSITRHNSAASSYVVTDWNNALEIDNIEIPIMQIFPDFLHKLLYAKPDKAVKVFEIKGKALRINPKITFEQVDDYFNTAVVGQNSSTVQIEAWNNFKAANPEFVTKLLVNRTALINFLVAFNSYKLEAMPFIYDRGRLINNLAFDFARRSVTIAEEPIFGLAKFAVLTNSSVHDKLEKLAILSRSEDELYTDGQRDQFNIPSEPVFQTTDVAAHQERFRTIFGDATEVQAKDALLKLIDLNSPLSNIAKILLKLGADVKITIQDDLIELEDGQRTSGVYNWKTDTIILSRQSAIYPDRVLLHELIHAHTHKAIRTDEYRDKANKIFKEAQKLIFNKYNVSSYEELLESQGSKLAYGFKNADEFFSELWTNSKFIEELNSVGTQKKTIWTKIKDFLLNILKINKTSKVYTDASVLLDEMISSTGESYFYRKQLESDPEFMESFEGLPESFFVPAEPLSEYYNGKTFYGDIEAVQDYFGLVKGEPLKAQKQKREPKLSGKMTFSYGNSKRPGIKADTTLHAIQLGERIATTRYESDGHLDYWKQAQVGDVIEFTNDNGERVLVEVTKPLTKLDENISAEEWSQKEGWSINYFNKHVLPKINEAWQIEYRLFSEPKPLTGWTLHSGGALGSDAEWSAVGLELGVNPNHYFRGQRTPLGNVEISEDEFKLGRSKIYDANTFLNRTNLEPHMNLLARNYIQVRNSDQVVAIGIISLGLETDGKIWNASVLGGTGWAVEMAIRENKPVFVYDQNRHQWFKNVNYSAQAGMRYFEPCDVPVLSKNFAGIGTREINEFGKQAIADAYKHTIIEASDNITDIKSTLDPDGLNQASAIYIFDEVKGEQPDITSAHFDDVIKMFKNSKPIYLIDVKTNNQYKYDDLLEYFDKTSIGTIEDNSGIKSIKTEEATRLLHNLLAKKSLAFPGSNIQTYEEIHDEPRQADLGDNITDLTKESAAQQVINPIRYNREQTIAIDGTVKAYRAKGGNQEIVTIIGKAGTGKTTIIGEILRQISDGKKINVVCGAVSNKAKQNLFAKIKATCPDKNVNITPKSIAGMLGKKPDQNGEVKEFATNLIAREAAEKLMRSADVVIVDEVSMVGETALADIEKLAHKALIIYLGDIRQVKPVESKALIAPGFERGQIKYELLERVRQGEGSAVLDYADIFGDIALKNPANVTLDDFSTFNQAMQQQESVVQDTNALYTINGTVSNVVSQIYPLVKHAIEIDDTSYFHIVPYHRNARNSYNNLIRTLLVNESLGEQRYSENEKDPNFIGSYPYQPGEWIVLNDAFETDNQILDNGTEIKVLEVKEETNENLTTVQGEDSHGTLWEAKLKIWNILGEYKDSEGKAHKVKILVPEYTTANIKIFNAKLDILRQEVLRLGGHGYLWASIFHAFNNRFADVSAPWALNIHKAQGQTYEISYIPVDDIIQGNGEHIHFNGGNYNKALVDTCSELYTAITRSANITILGSTKYFGATSDNLIELNESIKDTRKQQHDQSLADKVAADTGASIIEDGDTRLLVSGKLKPIYDFLRYVTGNDNVFKTLKSKESQDYLNELRLKFFQREMELEKLGHTFGKLVTDENGNIDFATIIKDPKVLDRRITADVAQNYPVIQNLKVKNPQIIMPQLLFQMGNRTLAEIDLNYFKTKNSFYESKVSGTDLLIRTHNGRINVVFSKTLEAGANARYGKPVEVTTDSAGYRLDANENRMYQIPENAVIYRDSKGNETLVIKNSLKTDADYKEAEKSAEDFINSIANVVSVQPFLTHFNDVKSIKSMIQLAIDSSVITTMEPDLRAAQALANVTDIRKSLDDLYKSKRAQKKYESVLANTLYNSFVRALSITSTRIPTQALASFMAMQVAAYNPSGANDVFVSRWQFWLQGSDLDIDKAFISGYGMNQLGIFEHWSRIYDYSTKERAELSDQLPVPNGKRVVLDTDARVYSGNVNRLLFVNNSNNDPELTALIKEYYKAGTDKTGRLAAVVNILKYLDTHNSFSVTSEVIANQYFKRLVSVLNKHNLGKVSSAAAKNLMQSRILLVCKDVRNIQSANTPIDAATSKLTSELNKLPGRESGSAYDGKSIFQLLEDNLTGKAVVGVMANALKAFLSMTQYFNLYYANTDKLSPEDTKMFYNRFIINGKSYSFANLANVVMTDQLAEQIATFAANLSGLSDQLLNTKDDMSIVLSAFTTLATDNAKLLALAKMRASLNLASMHCYLAMFGVPFADILAYTTSPLFTDLYDLTKANGYAGSNGTVTDQTWRQLLELAKSGTKYTLEDVAQLRRLFKLAQELKDFTGILGINQGMKSGIIDAVQFKQAFESLYNNLLLRLQKSRTTRFTNAEELLKEVCYLHGLNLDDNTRQYYEAKINKVIPFLMENNMTLYNIKVDMNRYFTDEKYKQGIIDCYDIIKGTINIFDILDRKSLPHFYEMLNSFNTTIQKMSAVAKSRFVFNQAQEYFHPDLINNMSDNNVPMFKLEYQINDFVVKRLIRFFDDYIISDFVLNRVAPILNISYTKNPTLDTVVLYNVDLTKADGLDKLRLLTFDIVSKLKVLRPENELLKQMTPVNINKNTALSPEYRYKLNFNLDSLSQKESEADILKYNQIVGGFNEIRSILISDLLNDYKNESDYQLTVGDILFLYNTIFNLDATGLGSLGTLFGDYILKSGENGLPMMKYQTYIEYDTGKKSIVPDEKLLNYYIFRNRLPSYLMGNMMYNGESINNTKPLVNLLTVDNVKQTITSYERFIEALRDHTLTIDIGEC